MKATRPKFREGIEWRKLTKAERAGKLWKYLLLKDVFFKVKTGVTRKYLCCGADGIVWATILPDGIWVHRNYAWNGNTASPDKLFGVWLLVASVVHDVLFQFSGCSGFPESITLSFANLLYFHLSPGFAGWAYFSGLSIGSWALWGKPPKDKEYVISYPLEPCAI